MAGTISATFFSRKIQFPRARGKFPKSKNHRKKRGIEKNFTGSHGAGIAGLAMSRVK
jgi:hypothetical protein